MAEYDGSIRIGTGIDTQGFDEDGKKLEVKARRLAENISGSSDVKIEVDASDAKKEIKEAFDDLEKEEKRIGEIAKRAVERARGQQDEISMPETSREGTPLSSPGYNQDAIRAIEEQSEKIDKIDEHWNQLRIDVEEYAKSLKELHDHGKFFGDEEYDKVYLAWKNATDAVKAYQAELNKQTESGQAKIAEQEAKAAEKKESAQRRAEEQAERALQRENERIQKQAENEAKLAAKEAERQAKIQAEAAEEQRLDQIRVNATVSNQEIVDLLERRKQLIAEIKDMEKAGVGLGYQRYEDANRELEEVNGKIKDYRKNLGSIPEKLEKMRKSANKAFNAVASGTKKSSGFLSTFSSRLKGIALSLLIFNWVSKGFNAMISGMKKGFENFMGYSDSYAQGVQNMKNAMSTLGNQFAAAFAPIVQMVIPWLTQLANAISTAMTYVAQFIAVLSGKSTFTRAKKVQDDYNKSLGGTAKAADKARGALAKFDDLDVLEKKEDATGGGGAILENVGADMFEEAPVEKEFSKLTEMVEGLLDQIKKIAQDFSIGDFFQAGKDTSALAVDIFNFISGAIKNVDWYGIGQKIGDFLSGIEWGEVLLSFGDLFWTAINSAIETAAGIFDAAPIETTILAGLSTLALTKDVKLSLMVSVALATMHLTEKAGNFLGKTFAEKILNANGLDGSKVWKLEDMSLYQSIKFYFSPEFEDAKEKMRPLIENWLSDLGLDWVIPIMNLSFDINWSEIGESFKKEWNEFVGSIFNFEITVPFMDSAKEWFSKISEDFKNKDWLGIGRDILFGILNGFIGGFSAIGEIVNNFLIYLWDSICSVFDMHSPSKAMEELGENIMAGILVGIKSLIENVWEAIQSVWDGIKKTFEGFIGFLTGAFTAKWDEAWNGIVKIVDGVKDVIKGIINAILSLIEFLVNGVISGLNSVINALNNLNFDVPDWIPGIGGSSFDLNISTIPEVSIPRLATGAVIRGGNPFMAILGDQPAGKTNIEAPLATIEQAVENVMSRNGYGRESVPVNINLQYDGETFARLSISDILSELGREGYNVDVLGVT